MIIYGDPTVAFLAGIAVGAFTMGWMIFWIIWYAERLPPERRLPRSLRDAEDAARTAWNRKA